MFRARIVSAKMGFGSDGNGMKLEVFDIRGKRVFVTDCENLCYSEREMRSMLANGYKVRVDGKVWKLEKRRE